MLSVTIANILELEAKCATTDDRDIKSQPGPPASEAQITRAERARGRKFSSSYRAFLAEHDGWYHVSFGINLYSTAELASKDYDRGFIAEMIEDNDDRLTKRVIDSLVIGWSENDASLVLLAANGEVIEWQYDEQRAHRDFDAFVVNREATLRKILAKTATETDTIEAGWTSQTRARREAELAKELRVVLATAPTVAREAPPKPKTKPAEVRPSQLVVGDTASVVQHLGFAN